MAFDAILFRNAECSLKYTNDFSNRVIVQGKIVQYPFFRKFKFGFKKWFDNQLLSDFVRTEEVVYPRLVRMFFANLQMNVEGTTLTSRVNGVDITVNPSLLAMIYSIPESGMQHYQTHKEVSVEGFNPNEELKKFTGREEISQDWPDASDFTIEFRLLHHMIINIFLPRSGGRSNVSNLDVYMMWAIANGKKLNFPFMMFHHMNDVLKRKKTSLPYGMALTKLFQYFEVRLDEETDKQTAKSTDFYNEGTMHRFGYTLEHNKWVPNPKTKRAIADREDEEADQSLLKKPTLRTTASTSRQIPPEIIALLQEMKDDIQSLKENQAIAASQPPPPTPASSSQQIPTEIIALLQDMKNDIQTLKANQPIAASQPPPRTLALLEDSMKCVVDLKVDLQTFKKKEITAASSSSVATSPEVIAYLDEMRNDIKLIKVRVDVIQCDLRETNTCIKMMEYLKEEIKICSKGCNMLINTQKTMTIKLDNLNEVMEKGLKRVLPAKPQPTPKMPRVRIYEVPEKLLILDVNGVLGHIMYTNSVPFASLSRQKLEFIIDRKQTIFKRPKLDEFLEFCFTSFKVAVWSSKEEKNLESVLNCMMDERKRDKLLFIWGRSKCTITKFKTLENLDKPLVLKDLRKCWEDAVVKGKFNKSNTLLLDDSPYQALINPPHTGLFPTTYKLERTKSDDELGTLQAYLQKLAAAENIPEFVSKHPFGQDSINEKGANGEELGIGNVFQVRGQWYGRNLEELRTYVVDVKELKAGRATRLPHPSMATGVSFEEAETNIGVMRVLWDSNMTLLYRPQ